MLKSVILLCVMSLIRLDVANAEIYQEAVVERIDIEAKTFERRADGVLWEHRITDPSTRYFRIEFDRLNLNQGSNLNIVIRNATGRVIAVYGASDIKDTSTFVTKVLYSNTLIVQVTGADLPRDSVFRMTKIIREQDSRGRLAPQNVLAQWLTYPEEVSPKSPAFRAAASVVKLFFGSGFICSGFLVGRQSVLTNYHCIEESTSFERNTEDGQSQCNDVQAHFDFNEQLNPDSAKRASCVKVLAFDDGLDYALLQLDVVPSISENRSREPLRLAERNINPSEPVLIVHHPAGLSKKVSQNCQAYYINDISAEHNCDTVGGSSGSPIISNDGVVVGLHNKGAFPKDMSVGQIEEAIRNGRVFRNRAIPVKTIREQILKKIM